MRNSETYLFVSLSDGRTIWIETLDKSTSMAWVNTGVVIGIFSAVEFFPNIYLRMKIFNMYALPEIESDKLNKQKIYLMYKVLPSNIIKAGIPR